MAFRGAAHIEVEGLLELKAAIKRQQGKLPDALGRANRRVGNFIISKLPAGDPHAVGAGRGAAIRASATKRDVVLRVGYGTRETTRGTRGGIVAQWGTSQVQPFRSGRPYIVGAIDANQAEIEQVYLWEVTDALAPAFHSAE